jgi:hypothetical protein
MVQFTPLQIETEGEGGNTVLPEMYVQEPQCHPPPFFIFEGLSVYL